MLWQGGIYVGSYFQFHYIPFQVLHDRMTMQDFAVGGRPYLTACTSPAAPMQANRCKRIVMETPYQDRIGRMQILDVNPSRLATVSVVE